MDEGGLNQVPYQVERVRSRSANQVSRSRVNCTLNVVRVLHIISPRATQGLQTGANAPIVALTCKFVAPNLARQSRPTHLVDVLEAVPSLGSHAEARLLI